MNGNIITRIDSRRAEVGILGGLLLDNALWPQTTSLTASDFSLRAHKLIFEAMKKLFEANQPADMITLVEKLGCKELEAVGGVAYLSGLIDGVPERPSIKHYVQMVRDAACGRHIAHVAEEISELARRGTSTAELRDHLVQLDQVAAQYEPTNSEMIRGFDSVPDLLSMEITPMDYVVEGLIPRRSLMLWTGIDGTAKTFLAQNLAIAVSTGGKFLGSQCRKMPVLILDYENPDFIVRSRLELMSATPNPNLKVWGTWLPEPPQVGNQLLLTIAKEVQPLMVFDPFRYSHAADENDSTEMMQVMRNLRAYVSAGATVIILHHPAKVEGSTGRGSTVIRGAVDLAYLQELSDETGLISLQCVKNRFGERPSLNIRPNFDEGRFEVTDSPAFTKMLADVDALSKIIGENPWLPQNQVLDRWSGNRKRGIQLLKKYAGSRWQMIEKGRSLCYGPSVPESRNHDGTDGTDERLQGIGSTVPPPKGGNRLEPILPSAINTSSKQDAALEPIPASKEEKSPTRLVCPVHNMATIWWRRGEDWLCSRCHPNPALLQVKSEISRGDEHVYEVTS